MWSQSQEDAVSPPDACPSLSPSTFSFPVSSSKFWKTTTANIRATHINGSSIWSKWLNLRVNIRVYKTLHQDQRPPTKHDVRVNIPLQNITSGSASTNKMLCQGQRPPAKHDIRVSVHQQNIMSGSTSTCKTLHQGERPPTKTLCQGQHPPTEHYVRVNIHLQNMSRSMSTCNTLCQGQQPPTKHYVKVIIHLQNVVILWRESKKKWSSSQDYGTWEVIKTPTEMPTRQKGGQQSKNNPTSSSCMISSMISVGLLLYFVAALMASRNNWNRKRYNIYNIFQFHTWLRFCSSSKAESVMMLHCRNTALIYFSDDQKGLMNSETSSRQKAKLWLAGRASFSVFTGLEALLPVLGIQASALLQLF